MNICIQGTNELAASYKTALKQAGLTAIKSSDYDKADTVAVCLPLVELAQEAQTSALNGKNVIVPLPFAPTLREAEHLASLCARQNILLIPALHGRYCGNIADLKAHIQSRTIGDCGVVNWTRYCPFAQKPKSAASHTPDSTLHLLLAELDTVHFVFGSIEKSHYAGQKAHNTDYSVLTAQTGGGILLQIEALYGSVSRPYTVYEASGTEGTICFDSRTAESVRFDRAHGDKNGTSCGCGNFTDGGIFTYSLPQTSTINPFRLMFADIECKIVAGTTAQLLNEVLESYRLLDTARVPEKERGGR